MPGEYNLYFMQFATSLKNRIKTYRDTHNIQKNNPEEQKLQALEAIATEAENKAIAEVSQTSAALMLRTHAADLLDKVHAYTDAKFPQQQQNLSGLNGLITKFIKLQNDSLTEFLETLKASQNRTNSSSSESDEKMKELAQQLQQLQMKTLEIENQKLRELLNEKENVRKAQEAQISLAAKLAEANKETAEAYKETLRATQEAREAEKKMNSGMVISQGQPDLLAFMRTILQIPEISQAFIQSNQQANDETSSFPALQNGSYHDLNGNGIEQKNTNVRRNSFTNGNSSALFSSTPAFEELPEEYQVRERPKVDIDAQGSDKWKLTQFLSDARRLVVFELVKAVRNPELSRHSGQLKAALDLMLETYDQPCKDSWSEARKLVSKIVPPQQLITLDSSAKYSDVLPSDVTPSYAYSMLQGLYHTAYFLPNNREKLEYFKKKTEEAKIEEAKQTAGMNPK